MTDDLPLFVSAREAEAAKVAALDGHERRSRSPLVRLRLALRELYQWRSRTDPDAYVTADDAASLLHDWPADERPQSLACLGALFRAPGWRAVGFTRSARVTNKAADLRKWIWCPPLDAAK